MAQEISLRYSLLILLIFALGAGLPCFLLGCDKSGLIACPLYSAYQGTVYAYSVEKRSCKDCKKCTYYDCWDVYQAAREKYNNATGENLNTCHYLKYEGLRKKPNASSYSIGGKVNWLKKKGTKSCSDSLELNSVWITGVVLLAFSSLFCICLICDLIRGNPENSKIHNEDIESPRDTTMKDRFPNKNFQSPSLAAGAICSQNT